MNFISRLKKFHKHGQIFPVSIRHKKELFLVFFISIFIFKSTLSKEKNTPMPKFSLKQDFENIAKSVKKHLLLQFWQQQKPQNPQNLPNYQIFVHTITCTRNNLFSRPYLDYFFLNAQHWEWSPFSQTQLYREEKLLIIVEIVKYPVTTVDLFISF